jgi:Ca2+:H+ antiporter
MFAVPRKRHAALSILAPSLLAEADSVATTEAFTQMLSLGLSVLLISIYGLGFVFSLDTHREFFGDPEHAESGEVQWRFGAVR